MTKTRARNLRKNQTDAEKCLWRYLRNRGLKNHKFRRQHPVGPYIADFACVEKGLIVELDGGQHALQAEDDAGRTAYLQSRGFQVLRFWNNQVLTETAAVLEMIVAVLEGSNTPSP
ncbi:MAG: endonuclease domain-containing protein [Desulfobacterales bacterium]|nr:endonuclease domain-containing protein [Desulfobacterales bacterium]